MSRNTIKLQTAAGRQAMEKAIAQSAASATAPVALLPTRGRVFQKDAPAKKGGLAVVSSAAAPAAGKAGASTPGGVLPKGAGEIRIIGGQWRRTRLAVAQRPGLRPTPDRVRETLFNWLGQDLTGWRCLDAFAGTGALGWEAASRGAAVVTMVEQDATLVTQLNRIKERLDAQAVRVLRGDALSALRQGEGSAVDLVLLDPPFDALALFAPALKSAAQVVSDSGWIYLEAPVVWAPDVLAALGLVVHRYLKAGAVHAHLLRRGSPEELTAALSAA
jgi:16S rRNA (guanine966-N2)-methyltransferase